MQAVHTQMQQQAMLTQAQALQMGQSGFAPVGAMAPAAYPGMTPLVRARHRAQGVMAQLRRFITPMGTATGGYGEGAAMLAPGIPAGIAPPGTTAGMPLMAMQAGSPGAAPVMGTQALTQALMVNGSEINKPCAAR